MHRQVTQESSSSDQTSEKPDQEGQSLREIQGVECPGSWKEVQQSWDVWKETVERQAISSSPCSQGTGQETSLNWLYWARHRLDLRKLSPVGVHHGSGQPRLTAELPGQNKPCKHLAEQVWVWLVLTPQKAILPGQQRYDSGLFPVTLRCQHYNLCIANMLVLSTANANTKVYGLSPCPCHSVDGCTAQSTSRNAMQHDLHFSFDSIRLFAKELRSTSARNFEWSLKKDWNKPEVKEITSKTLNKQHPHHSAPCLSVF